MAGRKAINLPEITHGLVEKQAKANFMTKAGYITFIINKIEKENKNEI